MKRNRVDRGRSFALRLAAAQLNRWADTLVGIPFGARGALAVPRSPLPGLYLTDQERRSVASVLRRIAATPAALKALDGQRRRGRPRINAARDWRLAHDFAFTHTLTLPETAREVGRAWGVGRSVAKDTYYKCRKLPGWQQWATYEENEFRLARPHLTQEQFARAFSAKLRRPDK